MMHKKHVHKLLTKKSRAHSSLSPNPFSFYIQTYNKLIQQQHAYNHSSFFLPAVHHFSAHYNSLIDKSSSTSSESLAAAVFASMVQKSQPIFQEEEKSCIMAAAATIPKRVALAAKRKQEVLPKPFLLNDLQQLQRHDCGEDAFFVATDLNYIDVTSNTKTVAALGIADGVGGYARLDIDPSLMAWQLMENAKSCLIEEELNEQCPRQVMAHAYNTIRSKEQVAAGGCTACILVIQKDLTTNQLFLKSANLGDSGYIVLRNGEIIYKTTEVTHGFNAPFQLAIPPKNHPTPVFQDDPKDAHVPESPLELQPGDVIVLGTDGIFDNIFDEQVQEIVLRNFKNNQQTAVNQTVAELVELSRDNSLSRSVDTPFAKAARENSYYHKGGKPDDITCVVAVVGGSELLEKH